VAWRAFKIHFTKDVQKYHEGRTFDKYFHSQLATKKNQVSILNLTVLKPGRGGRPMMFWPPSSYDFTWFLAKVVFFF
jgi:hypothetical protein